MKKNEKLSAFTLIELLIVIAIIGVLATLMFPAIQGAMNNANGVKIGNNGANIVKAIMAANIEREAASKGSVWPTKTKGYGSSNDYFANLMKREVLDGVSYAVFAGAGVAAANDDTKLASGGNIWNCLAGIESCDDALPFIWTRNLDGIVVSDFGECDPSNENYWNDKLDSQKKGIKPFAGTQVVLVRKGGAVGRISRKLISDYTFLEGVALTNGTSNVEILVAKDDSTSSDTGF